MIARRCTMRCSVFAWLWRCCRRVPYHIHEQVARITTAKTELFKQLHRQPTMAELSAATGMSVEKIQEALSANSAVASLETPAAGDGDEGAMEMKDMLAVSAQVKPSST